jgi:hypothetical protein
MRLSLIEVLRLLEAGIHALYVKTGRLMYTTYIPFGG